MFYLIGLIILYFLYRMFARNSARRSGYGYSRPRSSRSGCGGGLLGMALPFLLGRALSGGRSRGGWGGGSGGGGGFGGFGGGSFGGGGSAGSW